jgi:hypothetical protein
MMFEYADWWRRAKTWGEPADDVVAAEFTPNFVALKYDENGAASPFLQRSYVARRLIPGLDLIVDLHPLRYTRVRL